ncbi:MAG: cbb3-type cytochrome c oxidase subunit I [Bacteroidales bacterium]|nr:cbb3-type cytochrome c oxidase subunit I [Bacteroidales bacterium]
MKQTLLDKFMSKKGLYTSFWFIAILMVTALIYFTANLQKEVPPIAKEVKSVSGEVLYTYDDVAEGKGYFQQFDLMDWGSMLGMGAYMGPDFSTEFFHHRALYLYEFYAQEMYSKSEKDLTDIERGAVKVRVKQDFHEQTKLMEEGVTYTDASAEAYKRNVIHLTKMLVEGEPERAFPGGVIRKEEAVKIAAFVDWSQMVASSIRPGTEGTNSERTWSNNWPPEPLVDQDTSYNNHIVSLFEFLVLWVLTIVVIFLTYEYLLKKDDIKDLQPAMKITKLFPSQKKLLKYLPIVSLLFVVQVFLGAYLAHLYADPTQDFIFSQSWLPFNVIRSIHTQLAILWVAVGWLVGGLLIAPWIANKDHKFPWLVDVLWAALVVVAVGSMIGLYMGATGQLRETWFWLGNEGRELLNLGRLWDFGLLIGLVFWFLLIITLIKKASTNNPIVGTIIWSAFGIATLYIAGMMPIHKIQPNFTVDDYYRWWVIHLWVELTFELFAAGTIAFFSVSLGLVSQKTAERIMFFELFLMMMAGTLGVGHHYWWQGLDEYWIAIGGIFSAMEPLPLALMVVEAWKNYREKRAAGGEVNQFTTPFMWITGSVALNFIGAGIFGMVINTPTISYYSHGTYLIMPHAHTALLGAFGYVSIAFLYMTARANSLANGYIWNDKLSKISFWSLTIGVLLFTLPTIMIGLEQTRAASEMGYYYTRTREALDAMDGWMWFRILPDSMMIGGAVGIFVDLFMKTFMGKKEKLIA